MFCGKHENFKQGENQKENVFSLPFSLFTLFMLLFNVSNNKAGDLFGCTTNCFGYKNEIAITLKYISSFLTCCILYSSVTLGEYCLCVCTRRRYKGRNRQGKTRTRKKDRQAVAGLLSTWCLTWHGWGKMWCVLASAVARLPTRPARGIVNHVNDPDPREATAGRSEAVKYERSTCGREHMDHTAR